MANIVKSGAIVWIAPVGEVLPDETSVAYGAAWGGNWTRVGFTKEPLSFTYEDERMEIEVEEVLAADYLHLAGRGQESVTTTPAGAGQKGFEQVTFGDEAVIAKRIWGFEGLFLDSVGNEQPIRVFVYRGTATLNGALEFSKKSDDYTGVPLQVRALADTANGNRLWTFQRVTAPAT